MSGMCRIGLFTLLASSVVPALAARQTPVAPLGLAPTGLIVGQVVDAGSGRSVGNAVVTLTRAQAITRELNVIGQSRPAPMQRIVTDPQGRFVFRELPDGLYLMNANASGYITGSYGQRRPQSSAQPFVLAANQGIGDVVIRLWRAATIGGTITDEQGEPVVGVTVNLLRRSRTLGRWPFTVYNSGVTDDRGMYRVANNLPGQYYVVVASPMTSVPISVATRARRELTDTSRTDDSSDVLSSVGASRGPWPYAAGVDVGSSLLQLSPLGSRSLPPTISSSGAVVAYPATFYPNATSSTRATLLTLEPGEDRAGIDIQVRPVAMVTVSGSIVGPNGPEPNFGVRLIPKEVDAESGSEGPFETALTVTDGRGQFSFPAVPPGQFVVKAAKTGDVDSPTVATLWAETEISVGDAALSGVSLVLRAAPAIRGRVVFERTTATSSDTALRNASISFAAVGGRPTPCCPPARFESSGEFQTLGLLPGKYFPAVTNIPGWYLKTVTSGGRDVLRTPLVLGDEPIDDVVVTLTDVASEVSGSVLDSSGKPDPAASVVIFPADYQLAVADGVNTRVVRLGRPAPQTGSYTYLNVVPGDYLIAAAPDDHLSSWQDPEVIERLARIATRIVVAAGERKRVDLTVRSIQ
jgi:hypothetical protein